jgi:AhpD family alkylhydroperoxidase
MLNSNMLSDRVEEQIVRTGVQQVHYVRPVAYENANGLVAAVYEQMRRDFQLLTPITVHSRIPELLAGAWCITRETLIAGKVPRLHKEVVAAAVSQANQCTYCVDAHVLMLQGGKEDKVAQALATANLEKIPNQMLRSLAEWSLATRSANEAMPLERLYDRDCAAEIIGTAVAFHYINRVVDVFLEKSPMELPWALAWAKRPLGKIAAATFAKRLVRVAAHPGDSLQLLPDAQLPPDLAWAEANPFVAGAYARSAVVIESVGRKFIPGPVRALVLDRVARWNGETMGPSRAWVEAEIAALDERAKPAARLALVVALAPFQVDQSLVSAFRVGFPSADELLATVSWAAFTAARRIGSWLAPH